MSWQVRELTPADAERCAELEAILFPGDNPWPASAFVAEVGLPHTLYLGVEEQGKLLGYAGVGVMGKPPHLECEIHTIGVDPAFQRRGIARELMAQLLGAADDAQAPTFLEVRTDNEPAIALYQSLGFEITGVRKNYYQPSGADAFTMLRPAPGGEK
ncbi:ribosomal protein S18-alanine N-acetyltransferase [Corynebacterium tapiri]|uniref:Ribosomal-protein-alanine N-acetyltransferase n=1 Tax=Corynebacterium tapiri TaxID=1448266 RepID=A0A5C4U4K4_9CORY|nr:ribosomal protein S18-alanine N-acetyltransferase [Corynebacterium tapiri]TNL98506.1 ribosomal-protein-alanine N-acetyltransferase [Corynebacterium tapiri]